MSAIATVPLLIALPGLTFTDAFFETMSGLSTTGATVLTGLDTMAPSLNLWRHALQLVRRHGHHRAGGGDPADARRRRHAALQGRDAGTGQGRETHAAHHADRARAVVRVLPDHARVHRQPATRRHELVRRHLPRVCDPRARRLLHLRRERRPLRLAGDRIRADRVHADLGHELRTAFHRLAAEEPAHLRDRRRSQGDAGRSSASAPSASRCISGCTASTRTSGRRCATRRSTWYRSRPTAASSARTTPRGRCSRRWSS